MGKEKQKQCNICGKTFKRHQTMLDHKIDFHNKGVKKMVCPFKNCGYKTNRLGNLNYHLDKFHKLEMETKKCFSCHRKFKREENLIKHMKNCHFKPNFKTISCFCGEEVLTQKGLEIHKKIYHNDRTPSPQPLINISSPCPKKESFPKNDWRNLLKIKDLIYFSN